MSTLRILIVDDEPLAHNILKKYIDQIDYLELAGTCFEGVSAINFLEKERVDAILLDIHMPDLSGMELIEALDSNGPKIIFTTAYSEYAVESFNYEQVIDYLQKPIRLARFIKSMERLKGQLALERGVQEKPKEVDSVDFSSKKHITVKDNKVIYKIEFDDIQYMQAWGNYVKFFVSDGKVHLSRVTFRELEQILPKRSFVRVHKSYIVNIKSIQALDGNQIMIDTQRIPVGRSYLAALKNVL